VSDETVIANEVHAVDAPGGLQEQNVLCPKCNDMVPMALYCLKCGFPLYMFREEEEGVDVETRPDDGSLERVHALTKDLMNSISLKLWAVDQLRSGFIDEEHFDRLFSDYLVRSVQCMGQRKQLLAHYSRELASMARDLAPIERVLKEARVNLSELEMRKTIGDLLDGEYGAKSPALRWEIQHHDSEVRRRMESMTYLEDLTKVIPIAEIKESKEKVETAFLVMDDLLREGIVGPETATNVKVSLEETRVFLENFR
jgi:hypothetical protein